MEALVIFLFWIGIAVVAFVVYKAKKERERQQEIERQHERTEKKRLEECDEVVLFFHNYLGYIAKECIRRDELENLIDEGYTAEELADEIGGRIAEKDGLVLGYQPFADNVQVDVKLTLPFRERHIYVVGKSGSGKTNLIRNLIFQDLEQGAGIGVIAPEQEMITDEILPYIPDHRIDDVIYINPADTERPVCFNPLHLDEGEDIDLRADETFTIFQRVMGEGSGARMNEILRNTLYALLEKPNTTLLDIARLLDPHDSTFRDEVVRETEDPDTVHFFKNVYPQFPKDAHLPIINRIGRLTRPKYIRNVLCNPENSLNFRDAMDSGKIMLFNLSDGILGENNSQILGQLIVSKFQMATMSRAAQAKTERKHFWLYIDEFQTFTNVATTSYEKILSRARKYRLGLVLAHQQTSQIPTQLLKEIFGNVSTLVSFVVSSADATKLSQELITNFNGEIDHIPADDILSLKVGEAYCKIGQSSFFMRTRLADQSPDFQRAKMIIEHSRKAYGKKPMGRHERHETIPDATLKDNVEEDAFKDFDPDKLFG